MDAISEVLASVKLTGAVFFNAEFSAPWGVVTPGPATLAPALAPGAEHLVVYHLVVNGHARITMPDGLGIELAPGDVAVFPHGDPHLIANGQDMESPEQSMAASEHIAGRNLSLLRTGAGGQTTRLVCGFMACDPHLGRPILDGLPGCFKVNVRTDKSGVWLENSILHLVEEAGGGGIGTDAMLSKLAEVLFVHTLRRYIAGLPAEEIGWLAGARDPVVGRSLRLMHSRVDQDWTIADLAREVGVSRSALVERFTRYLSEPPMTYLAKWRLRLAARSLKTTPKSVADIATTVGYESEAAFNRAFKREFGMPPARYRREQRAAAVAASGATS